VKYNLKIPVPMGSCVVLILTENASPTSNVFVFWYLRSVVS
jgi:hypothetical protein